MRPGEIYGFVGANGAGKTTAMRIALGVLVADAGEVRWPGRPVDFETRRRFGYMPGGARSPPVLRVGTARPTTALLDGNAARPRGRRQRRTRSYRASASFRSAAWSTIRSG